ncbi:eukaryotic integral membrane protein-domain-containing protein [Scheffersomyces amazonensis]|uniref:eukaryotic integral membrane protein-domain-containing protein n=1 Tax=Scheffersomyces amazonensis TaxID=1078765 RepID=UPI00315DE113
MVSLLKTQHIPLSTRISVGLLAGISGLLFGLKFQKLREAIQAGSSSSFHDIYIPYLQLIPRSTIYYPWVIFTAIFAEISIITFIFSILVLIISTRYIEKFWGWKEVIKFIIIIGSITNFGTVLISIISNIIRNDSDSMDLPVGGGISYYFGFLVVFKQLIPEHNIVLFQGLVNVRVKHLPFTFLIIVILWSIIITRSLYPVIPSIGSFITSYTYLRFYQSFLTDPLLPITTATGDNSNSSLITGDASDTFQLVEFFPVILKPYLSIVFDKIYELSVLLGIVTPFNDESVEQSNIRAQKRQEQANQAQKSVANSVAERRRQVALQVIEDRINKESTA